MSQITWYGHSAFKIQCGDASALIDPFFASGSGFTYKDACPADLVLVTHDHGDHVGDAITICKSCKASLGCIVGTAQALVNHGLPAESVFNGSGFNIGGSINFKGMEITMVQAFHSSDSSSPVGYIIKMPDGLVIYHAGDTGIFGDMGLFGKLYGIDLALLPIGGFYTMDARQAAHACKLIGCDNVIPMHWGTFPILAQSPNEFKTLLKEICPACVCIAMERGHSVEIAPEPKNKF